MIRPNRVMIIGGPGSGKTTLSRRLAERLELPLFHLDALFWRPGRIEPDRDEFNAAASALIKGERWVLEGDYKATWAERAERADAVIFMDVNAIVRTSRVLRRSLRHRGLQRDDCAPGCPDRLSFEFLLYSLNYGRNGGRKALALGETPSVARKFIRVRNADEAMAALGLARPTPPAS